MAQQHQLTLWNDLTTPTRIGNSVSKDTTPDLTFSYNIRNLEWLRLDETLGSDHYIIQSVVPYQKTPQRLGKVKITDWKAFREGAQPTNIDTIEQWSAEIVQSVSKHTKTIQLTTDNPATDPHLLHLWDARRSMIKRWKNGKATVPSNSA